jgi:hypothetical protein
MVAPDCGTCGGVGAAGDEGEACHGCDGSGEGRTPPKPLSELRDTGLLWLINRVVFHPRGFALALITDEAGTVTGWNLLGDGSEAWAFSAERDDRHFASAQKTLTPRV